MVAFRFMSAGRRLPALAALVALCCPAFAAELTIGSRAPALDIEHWVQRAGRGDDFAPITTLEPGKVTVIEFWATWCPPCRASMPHLADLQKHLPTRA